MLCAAFHMLYHVEPLTFSPPPPLVWAKGVNGVGLPPESKPASLAVPFLPRQLVEVIGVCDHRNGLASGHGVGQG
jgi:hypothetical protein